MRALFFLVLLLRAVCDPWFEAMKSDGGTGGMGAGALLNALVIGMAALSILRRPRLLARALVPMWGAFLLTALASVAIAPDAANALRLFLVQVSYCAVFAMPFLLIKTNADVKACLLVVLWASVLPVLLALFELSTHGRDIAQESFRLQSSFTHPNIFAFFLVLMIALILYLQKSQEAHWARRWRWPLWLYMAVLLAMLLLTKTRSAWGGCFFIFLVYGLFFQRRFLLYAMLVPLLLLLEPGVRERLQDLASNNEVGTGDGLNSYAWRKILWQAGLEWMQASHALLGYGLDSFKYYSPRFFPLEGQDVWDPHNVYVQLVFETGMAGLFSYVWMFSRLLKRVQGGMAQDKPGTVILMATVLSYLLTSYFDNMLFYLAFNWYFWFFAGTACAAQRWRSAAPQAAHMAPMQACLDQQLGIALPDDAA